MASSYSEYDKIERLLERQDDKLQRIQDKIMEPTQQQAMKMQISKQMAMHASNLGLAASLGSGSMYSSSTATDSTWSVLADTFDGYSYQVQNKQYPQADPFPPRSDKVLCFFRINKPAQILERDYKKNKFVEPLDELRVNVAQWLNN